MKTEKKKKNKRWRFKEVCTVWFLSYRVKVRVDSERFDSANFRTPTEEDPHCLMTIGVRCAWCEVVGTLIHELGEMWMTLGGSAYHHVVEIKNSTQDRVFFLHHKDWDQLSAEVADAIVPISVSLKKVHEEVRRWEREDRKSK